jgi:hypothetical protein
MRFSAACVAALSAAGLATAGGWWESASQDVVTNQDNRVPGDSPLEFCDDKFKDDIAEIEKVDLSPNPPRAGNELEIKASGTVKKEIKEGAKVDIEVKYGVIRLLRTTEDLCEQLKNADVNVTCPVKEGPLNILKTVEIPKEVPNGRYTVHANVYNPDNERITCLQASVQFSSNAWSDL